MAYLAEAAGDTPDWRPRRSPTAPQAALDRRAPAATEMPATEVVGEEHPEQLVNGVPEDAAGSRTESCRRYHREHPSPDHRH